MNQDEEHLRLLSIFHYVVGGLAGVFALFPIFHIIFGLILILASASSKGKAELPPALIGWMFVLLAAVIVVVGLVFAVLVLLAGRSLGRRSHYMFCLVMGGVECLFMPLGTVLGVFTIIVLMRESVKKLFNVSAAKA